MNIRKGTKKVLLILILLANTSNSFGQNIKPDITVDIRQSTKSKSWNRTDCCYPWAAYEAAKDVFRNKVYENQYLMKIQDILYKYWQEHTHQQR